MKRFILEQSTDEMYTDCSGLALVGLCINRYSNLSGTVARTTENSYNLIPDTDLLRSYLGLLCTGKNDYEAVTSLREDVFFKEALGIGQVPSAETLRQRFDRDADRLREVAQNCSITLLKNANIPIAPLDIDVFPMDNSGTKIGQLGLLGKDAPVRHPVKRRRIKTVLQELIHVAACVIRNRNRFKLRFSCYCPV